MLFHGKLNKKKRLLGTKVKKWPRLRHQFRTNLPKTMILGKTFTRRLEHNEVPGACGGSKAERDLKGILEPRKTFPRVDSPILFAVKDLHPC